MSGHSKWSTIKRKKGKTDAERAKVFTKIGREMTVAVREGGPDPAVNSKLRDLIAKAKPITFQTTISIVLSKKLPADRIKTIMKTSFMKDTDQTALL